MATKILIINESHSVLPQQAEILGDFERFNLPDTGATLAQVKTEIAPALIARAIAGDEIVFATPFAALMVELCGKDVNFSCLHNDKRVAKEVPDGKGGVRVVHSVAPDGWVLVRP
jgi:hypothetical protein